MVIKDLKERVLGFQGEKAKMVQLSSVIPAPFSRGQVCAVIQNNTENTFKSSDLIFIFICAIFREGGAGCNFCDYEYWIPVSFPSFPFFLSSFPCKRESSITLRMPSSLLI